MEVTLSYVASQILSVAMYPIIAITYYLKDRHVILLMNIIGSILIGIAFLLLSAYTGATIFTYTSFLNLLAVFATSIFTYALWHKKTFYIEP